MFRDRTNLYLAYRSTFPHHLSRKKKSVSNNVRFEHLKQEEEGLLHGGDDGEGGIEMNEFRIDDGDNMVTEQNDQYTVIIQTIENQGNDLTQRIKQNMKELNKKYKEVLLPQFDDDVIQNEMNIVNELSNTITNELRMIYKVINELQKLDDVLVSKESEVDESSGFRDELNNNTKGSRILISNLKKKFALVSQELSGEFREMQGKYIRYLKKDEIEEGNQNGKKDDVNGIDLISGVNDIDVESYSRNAMVESSKEIESKQMQLQLNKNELIDDQQYLLERERKIYKISQNVVEISIIFKELENIVIDQGTILDNIEYNLDRTVENVKSAHKQLNKAEGYQKQTRKCKIVLFLVLLIFLCLMLLMVKPKRVDHYVHDVHNGGYTTTEGNVIKATITTSSIPSEETFEGEIYPTDEVKWKLM